MKNTIKLVKNTRGANFVEYLIIVGVVALIGLTAFMTFGSNVKQKVMDEGTKVQGIQIQ